MAWQRVTLIIPGAQAEPASEALEAEGAVSTDLADANLSEAILSWVDLRGANLIGRAIETMSAVDAVAGDFDTWEGICGKDGQSAPVGSGSPTLRISRITIGGTGA